MCWFWFRVQFVIVMQKRRKCAGQTLAFSSSLWDVVSCRFGGETVEMSEVNGSRLKVKAFGCRSVWLCRWRLWWRTKKRKSEGAAVSVRFNSMGGGRRLGSLGELDHVLVAVGPEEALVRVGLHEHLNRALRRVEDVLVHLARANRCCCALPRARVQVHLQKWWTVAHATATEYSRCGSDCAKILSTRGYRTRLLSDWCAKINMVGFSYGHKPVARFKIIVRKRFSIYCTVQDIAKSF